MALERRAFYQNISLNYEQQNPENISPDAGRWYKECMNLENEFKGYTRGTVVYDIGASYAKGTDQLQQEFNKFRFIAITPQLVPRKAGDPTLSIPYIPGTAEELPKVITNNHLQKPNILLLRNTLHLGVIGEVDFQADGLLTDMLQGLYNSLPIKGKVLVWDFSGKENYPLYKQRILQERIHFNVQELPSKPYSHMTPEQQNATCRAYLRMTKTG